MRKVIGAYCLGNAASVNVYEIDHCEDRALIGYNDDDPKWVDITYDIPEDRTEGTLGFFWGEMFIPFDEVMRV